MLYPLAKRQVLLQTLNYHVVYVGLIICLTLYVAVLEYYLTSFCNWSSKGDIDGPK